MGGEMRVLGVDGGGSLVRAACAGRDGRILGQAQGPGAVAERAHPEWAADAVESVAREAAERAGAALPMDALWAGVAGAGRDPTREALEALLAGRGLARRVRVGTDLEAAFADAYAGGPGLIVLAGTGSVAVGRGEDGREARVGGWGWMVGDEGSGYDLGRGALRAVTRAADGRDPPTALSAAVLEAAGLDGPAELIDWAAVARRSQIAALAQVVGRCARAGDAAASALVDRAVRDLLRHVETLVVRLGPWSAAPTVTLAGGLLGESGPLRAPFEAALQELGVEARPGSADAVRGAVAHALALATGSVSAAPPPGP